MASRSGAAISLCAILWLMQFKFVQLLLVVVLLSAPSVTACQQSPTPPQSTISVPATETLLPSITLPTPQQTTSFWLADVPVTREVKAFGRLPPEYQPASTATISSFVGLSSFPSFPSSLDAYVVGSYPITYTRRFNEFVPQAERVRWEFYPEYSTVQYLPTKALLRSPQPLANTNEAVTFIQLLLSQRGLLLPDTTLALTQTLASDEWHFTFLRRINNIPIYTNKALSVSVRSNGEVTDLVGRRRPLLAKSSYPLRSVEQAWQQVLAGKWYRMYVDDGGPRFEGHVDQFVVTSVELAYVEAEVTAPEQIMQPYYVFRNQQRQTIYVPAIVEELITPVKTL